MSEAKTAWNVARVREDFPILHQQVNGHPLVYLDNAATTQKPKAVIDAIARFYSEDNSNIHRGVHALSQRATAAYEESRARVARFINAGDPSQIVFVRGATEGINLVAQSFGRPRFHKGDVIVLTGMEHHANIVPWQLLRDQVGVELEILTVSESGEIDLEAYRRVLDERKPVLVACVHASNTLGTVNPVAEMTRLAHASGVPVLVDAAQSAPHFRLDVAKLDCDFLVFSGHKVFGPTGIGILYGKADLLESMPPYQGGGDMISRVSFAKTEYKQPPERFEAGTPNIAGVIGLAAAIEYLESLDHEGALAHEQALLEHAQETLLEIPGLRIIGTAPDKVSVVSFVMEDVHPHDIGTFLDVGGIAVRAGHHCTQPLMDHFGLPGTARASFAFYNTFEEINALAAGLRKIRTFFC